jgi:hypothetical protein
MTGLFFVPPASAKKPHHAKGHRGHKSHGFGHVSIGPYGFDVGYIGKNFGVNVGPFMPGFADGFGVADGPGPEIGYAQPPIGPVTNVVPAFSGPPAVHGAYGQSPAIAPAMRTVVPTVATEFQSMAETAFSRGHYTHALRLSQHALLDDPRNGKLQLFVSQVLLALGDYPAAAASLAAGISTLNAREWGYVVERMGQFGRNQDYVMHMNRLVQSIHEHPGTSSARLLRGYHYLYLGHQVAARDDLQLVAADEGNNHVARLLLNRLDARQPATNSPVPSPPAPGPESPVELLPTPALRSAK